MLNIQTDRPQQTVKTLIRRGVWSGSILFAFILQFLGTATGVFCLFELRFYSPVNPMGSCRVQSVFLTTCLLGRLSPLRGLFNQYCAHSFARNWKLPFLNQRKEENDHRKYFVVNLHERMLPTSAGVEPPGLQSDGASNWATEADNRGVKMVWAVFRLIAHIPLMGLNWSILLKMLIKGKHVYNILQQKAITVIFQYLIQ